MNRDKYRNIRVVLYSYGFLTLSACNRDPQISDGPVLTTSQWTNIATSKTVLQDRDSNERQIDNDLLELLKFRIPAPRSEMLKTMRIVSHIWLRVADRSDLAVNAIKEFWTSGQDRTYPTVMAIHPETSSQSGEILVQFGILGRRKTTELNHTKGSSLFPTTFRLGLIECLGNIRTPLAIETLKSFGQETKSSKELTMIVQLLNTLDSKRTGVVNHRMNNQVEDVLRTNINGTERLDLLREFNGDTDPKFFAEAQRLLTSGGELNLDVFAYLESELGRNAVPIYIDAFDKSEIRLPNERGALAGCIENYMMESPSALDFVKRVVKDKSESDLIRNGLIQGFSQSNPLSGKLTEFSQAEAEQRIQILTELETELPNDSIVQIMLMRAMKDLLIPR